MTVPQDSSRTPQAEASAESCSTAETAPPLDGQPFYLNREFSLLSFSSRVLDEAFNTRHPLLERVKFLAIVGSNLTEFFMVRVAGLKHQVDANVSEVSMDGLTPQQQLAEVRVIARGLMGRMRACLGLLLRELEAAGIHILNYEALDESQQTLMNDYFRRMIYPVLTPLAYDPARPFPFISNQSLNLAVLLRDTMGRSLFARVKVPNTLPRLLPIAPPTPVPPPASAPLPPESTFVWLEQVIAANLGAMFPGMQVEGSYLFRVTRDAEYAIQELEAPDLLESIEHGIRQRRFGAVVRLTVDPSIPDAVRQILVDNLDVDPEDLYNLAPPLGVNHLMQLCSLDRPDLKDPPFTPRWPSGLDETAKDLFGAIRRQDILLHHPYDSFMPIVEFLETAAQDPDVLAIKQTLYRVGRNAPVVEALLKAARNGKQVSVLVELKARFDEESNIEWARALEREGVHVVYGVLGLKTHSKLTLVVRKEGDVLRRYVHLSTGNYNAVTAHVYTDVGLLTSADEFGADATELFNYLTGYSATPSYGKFLVAPTSLRQGLETLIRREIARHKQGEPGHIIFKLNALVDRNMIDLLYEASQAGVRVDLLVRGICCLRPGVPGLSDRIHVMSIVGRFLEHSRIYYFRNGEQDELYIGSADLMPRNLDRRVEILAPIEDQRLLRYLRDQVLHTYLSDTVNASLLQPDGSYRKVTPGQDPAPLNSHAVLLSRPTSLIEPMPEHPIGHA